MKKCTRSVPRNGFTDTFVRGLKAQNKRYEIFEPGRNGFGVRVSPRGARTFVTRLKIRGKTKRITLGQYPSTSLYTAHRKHDEIREDLANNPRYGVDSLDMFDSFTTIKEMAAMYLDQHAKPFKKTWREDQRIVDKNIVPEIGRMHPKDLRRREARQFLDRIATHSPVLSIRVMSIARKMYNWAMDEEYVDRNPFARIKIRGYVEHPRTRVLSEREIGIFLRRLDKTDMTETVKLCLRFILVTAQRPQMVAATPWEEISFQEEYWIIPPGRLKNTRHTPLNAHQVPLSPIALSILRQAKRISGDSPFVFASPEVDGEPIQKQAAARALHRNRKVFGLERFHAKDLQRTAATSMSRLGVIDTVIDRILAHVQRGVIRHYNHHDFELEKISALNLWSSALTGLANRSSRIITVNKPSGQAESVDLILPAGFEIQEDRNRECA